METRLHALDALRYRGQTLTPSFDTNGRLEDKQEEEFRQDVDGKINLAMPAVRTVLPESFVRDYQLLPLFMKVTHYICRLFWSCVAIVACLVLTANASFGGSRQSCPRGHRS